MRKIIYSEEFEKCVERLGGYRAIDAALEPIIDGLVLNPYGFELFENDHTSFRFAKTREIRGVVPALIVVFTLDSNRDVVMEWVDDAENF